ncbi:MAG: hypothetical protein BWY57_02489 [Betaproteobacteria bacterium ADurb.Bin341]|nr:MAG: hypothetical protein BWY57_02489 [Betaproteobacteria bacterium ADurb.Bin341]
MDVLTGELRAETYLQESFDAILMSHVIEHMQDPQAVIAETLRLLRPGGVLIILTPNTKSLGHRWFKHNWLHLDPPRHLHLFNCSNLSKCCLDAGFDRVSYCSSSRDAHWTLGASLALRQQKRYIVGQLPLLLKLLGFSLFYLEWFILLFFPEKGEEILIKAQRPTTDQTQ